MEFSGYIRFFFALILVLALIGGLALVARRMGFGHFTAKTGKQRRLTMVEAMNLDGKRRAVLFRRDKVEHLVILGPNSETVVETGIPAAPEAAPAISETETGDR